MRFVVAVLLMTAVPVNAVFAECAWVLWSDETVYVFTGEMKGKAFVPDENSDIRSPLARSSPLRSRIVEIETAAAKLPDCTAIRRARLKQRMDEAKKSGDYDEVLLDKDETVLSTFKWHRH